MLPIIRRPPGDRTHEQLWRHFLVESALARQLKESAREDRPQLLASMYEILFAQVPDHPRLTRRADADASERAVADKRRLLTGMLDARTRFVEFAPGDCLFLHHVAGLAAIAVGLDISNQRSAAAATSAPVNCRVHLYDGYRPPSTASGPFDVAFSDQLLEHLRPDDVLAHLTLVRDLLVPGVCTCSVRRTPPAARGMCPGIFATDPRASTCRSSPTARLGRR